MLDFKVDEIDLFPNHIWISEISNIDNDTILNNVKESVEEMCSTFKLYPNL